MKKISTDFVFEIMVVASVRILSLVYTVWNLIIVSGGVLAEDLQLEGDLTREPENGLVQKDEVMKCLQNGEVPEGLQWYTIKDDEDPELITSGKNTQWDKNGKIVKGTIFFGGIS